MIGKIQSYAPFKGVFIKRNGEAHKNIKKAYRDLELNNDSKDGIISMTEFQRTSFNATLDYGLKQLNDSSIDDGKTRFLSFYPFYSRKTGKLSGYNLNIVEQDGKILTSSASYLEGAGVYPLKTAFDGLKENYKDALTKATVQRYGESFSTDDIISPYVVDDGPADA